MRNFRKHAWLLFIMLFLAGASLQAMKATNETSAKKLDLLKYHDVGNIWLRVSNYGFFGSGDDITPQWPSLEYPGGSGIDYLYQGALWFGAKKYRRNAAGRKYYWLHDPPASASDYVAEGDVVGGYVPGLNPVVDTLVTVGFDGDLDLYEFLPAYNTLENSALGAMYSAYNLRDTVLYSSTRFQRAGTDDDGDGWIDEDPPGHAFPFRSITDNPLNLPSGMEAFSGMYLHDVPKETEAPLIQYFNEERGIWFPLGFVDLDAFESDDWCITEEWDDDADGLYDEDGYPVSEQDYISFYYDYSPFGTPGQRDWGSRRTNSDHYPLNILVRQMSYQWSYEYIKNLVYVEFDITNKNVADTLFDCAMGIYMDSDVGPQSWGADERSLDDISSYVAGEGYEFAYTYDADGDGGLTTGYVGSRVCTPDPEELEFACWYWNRGDGPDDEDPYDLNPSGPTANQKYWLLTDRNPDDSKYVSLRDEPDAQMGDPDDTRYLFAFYGDMQGMTANADSSSWNLKPGETMKIVIAIFPGESVEELKQTAGWAKIIYGDAQTLTTVVLPDTFAHYQPPEPPDFPKMFCELENDGNRIALYWDNRSEFSYDIQSVDNSIVGWQDSLTMLPSYRPDAQQMDKYNPNAYVDPATAYRLRHDFQGYSIWGRSGTGNQEYWEMKNRWDKIDTTQDYLDYNCVINFPEANYYDFGGDLGNDTGLPNARIADADDTVYYHYNDQYEFVHYAVGDNIYGYPLYDPDITDPDVFENMADNWDDTSINPKYNPSYSQYDNECLIFRNPNVPEDIYMALYDDNLVTLPLHLGQNFADSLATVQKRLASRYYRSEINNPPKGVEYYVATTAFDRGLPANNLLALESGRDEDANMKVIFPGPNAQSKMDNIYVVPNPYLGLSNFDGRRENDDKGDKSKRIWFVNLPEHCTIRIYTLAGDLVDKIEHDGAYREDVITVSKAAKSGIAASGIHAWDVLSMHNQIVVSGLYLFSVEDHDSGENKVGKFVIIR